MLAPHDGVHGQLGAGGAAAKDLDDLVELVLLQAQLGPREFRVRGLGSVLNGVDVELLGGFRGSLVASHNLGQNGGEETEAVGVAGISGRAGQTRLGAEADLHSVLGVRHEAHYVAGSLEMPAMSRREPFGLKPT